MDHKKVSFSFCPNCKSADVKYVFELSNLFGVIPKQRCGSCKKEGIFPILVTNEKEINLRAKNNKIKKVSKI